jgi:hypothetical protein
MATFRELKVVEWWDEIDRGLAFRREYGREQNWATLEKLFYNSHESQANEGPNIIYSTGEALLSSLSTPYPYITIKPRTSNSLMKARIVESVDNMLVTDMQLCEEIECVTLSTYLHGTGILKIGYDSEFGFAEELDIGGIGATMSQGDKNNNLIEYAGVRPGMPWVRHVLPQDFVVPWGTRDLESAPWCAHRVVRHIDHVKSDPKYEGKSDLKPVMSRTDYVKSYQSLRNSYRVGTVEPETGSFANSSEEPDHVELWEIHDRRTNKLYVIATGHKRFLRNQRDSLQVNGLPFVATSFVPKARNFWVTSDAEYLLQGQAELTDIALQKNKKRRADLLKFLYAEGAISDSELDNLTSAEVGVGIKVKGGFDIQKAVAFLQSPQGANQGLMMEAEDVRRNAREMVGLSSNQMGEYAGGRRSATEANVVSQHANMRLNRRQSKIAYLYENVFRKVNPIIFKYWKSPRVAEIVGPNGPLFFDYTGDMIDADYSYKIGFTVEPPESLQQRKQAALMSMQIAMQLPGVNPQALSQYIAMAFNDPEFAQIFGQGQQGAMNGGNAPQPAQQAGLEGAIGGAAGGNGMGQGGGRMASAIG